MLCGSLLGHHLNSRPLKPQKINLAGAMPSLSRHIPPRAAAVARHTAAVACQVCTPQEQRHTAMQLHTHLQAAETSCSMRQAAHGQRCACFLECCAAHVPSTHKPGPNTSTQPCPTAHLRPATAARIGGSAAPAGVGRRPHRLQAGGELRNQCRLRLCRRGRGKFHQQSLGCTNPAPLWKPRGAPQRQSCRQHSSGSTTTSQAALLSAEGNSSATNS